MNNNYIALRDLLPLWEKWRSQQEVRINKWGDLKLQQTITGETSWWQLSRSPDNEGRETASMLESNCACTASHVHIFHAPTLISSPWGKDEEKYGSVGPDAVAEWSINNLCTAAKKNTLHPGTWIHWGRSKETWHDTNPTGLTKRLALNAAARAEAERRPPSEADHHQGFHLL